MALRRIDIVRGKENLWTMRRAVFELGVPVDGKSVGGYQEDLRGVHAAPIAIVHRAVAGL